MKQILKILIPLLMSMTLINTSHACQYNQLQAQAEKQRQGITEQLINFIPCIGTCWNDCNEIRTEEAQNATEPTTTQDVNIYDYFTDYDINLIAGVMYSEYNGITENSGNGIGEVLGGRELRRIGWAILNRMDSTSYDFRNQNTVSAVVNASGQMTSLSNMMYRSYAVQVLTEYTKEKNGLQANRELDRKYMWWGGNGKTNTFRSAFSGQCYRLNIDSEWWG